MIILQRQPGQGLRILQKRVRLLFVTPREHHQRYGKQRADHEEPHDHAREGPTQPGAWIASSMKSYVMLNKTILNSRIKNRQDERSFTCRAVRFTRGRTVGR